MTLQLRHVTKTFGGQTALCDVDLSVAYGEVHALVGQNGSGKSTLIKLLSGYHQPDPGAEAEIDGHPFQIGSAHAARTAGLRFVHQDLALVLSLSVLDNVMLGRPYPVGFGRRIRQRRAAEQVRRSLRALGVTADVRSAVSSLSMAERSAVAIARCLSDTEGSRALFVFDEPTAALPSDDVGRLLAAINNLRAAGHGILLVSHHLNEVLEVADRVTVLRDGRVAASVRRNEINQATLAELIVGQPIAVPEPATERRMSDQQEGKPLLQVQRLTGGRLSGIDFDLHAGEVLGVAGITGSGRESLAPLISGGLRHAGQIDVAGQHLNPGDAQGAIRAGVVSIPGERARYGIFPNFSVRHNLTISLLDRHRRWGRINKRQERAEVDEWIRKLGIVTQGGEAKILSLSGGNQQKVLVARALRMHPKVLVLDDPTQGIDIGARAQIHEVIEQCAADGMGILLISTDSDELSRLSDRLLVLGEGRVVHVLTRGPALTARSIDMSQLDVKDGPGSARTPESSKESING
jgi:ribose transport system ATP-binding protein